MPRPTDLRLTNPSDVGILWESRAVGSVVERLVHTEEVTGSNPVSPILLFLALPYSAAVSAL